MTCPVCHGHKVIDRNAHVTSNCHDYVLCRACGGKGFTNEQMVAGFAVLLYELRHMAPVVQKDKDG